MHSLCKVKADPNKKWVALGWKHIIVLHFKVIIVAPFQRKPKYSTITNIISAHALQIFWSYLS